MTNFAMQKRDEGVESLRVLLMFGICLLHSISQCGHTTRWLGCPLCACVDAFVFISGYYGIKFKLSKLIRLYTTGLVCVTITIGLSAVLGEEIILKAALDAFKNLWFLHAYAVMMLLAPLIDKKMGIKESWTVLSLVFVWGGSADFPKIGHWLPRSAGLQSYSGLTLLGIYVAARLFRHYELEKRIKRWHIMVALPVLYGLSVAGWYNYATPVALGLATIMFMVGRKLKLGVVGSYLAPSTFAIYLLHSNAHGFAFMTWLENWLLDNGMPMLLAYFAVGTTTFLVCAILDVPRRVFCLVFKMRINAICARVDSWMDMAVECFDKLLAQSTR